MDHRKNIIKSIKRCKYNQKYTSLFTIRFIHQFGIHRVSFQFRKKTPPRKMLLQKRSLERPTQMENHSKGERFQHVSMEDILVCFWIWICKSSGWLVTTNLCIWFYDVLWPWYGSKRWFLSCVLHQLLLFFSKRPWYLAFLYMSLLAFKRSAFVTSRAVFPGWYSLEFMQEFPGPQRGPYQAQWFATEWICNQ